VFDKEEGVGTAGDVQEQPRAHRTAGKCARCVQDDDRGATRYSRHAVQYLLLRCRDTRYQSEEEPR